MPHWTLVNMPQIAKNYSFLGCSLLPIFRLILTHSHNINILFWLILSFYVLQLRHHSPSSTIIAVVLLFGARCRYCVVKGEDNLWKLSCTSSWHTQAIVTTASDIWPRHFQGQADDLWQITIVQWRNTSICQEKTFLAPPLKLNNFMCIPSSFRFFSAWETTHQRDTELALRCSSFAKLAK